MSKSKIHIPEISGTKYKSIEKLRTMENPILYAQKSVYIPDVSIKDLKKLFTNTLPERDPIIGKKEEDIANVLQVMSDPRYRRWSLSYMQEYTELSDIIAKGMQYRKNVMDGWIGFMKKKEIKIVLPAFANKSYNPLKSTKRDPDIGEISSLLHLSGMCRDIEQVYWAPVRLTIVTDGVVYAPLFDEPIEEVRKYRVSLEWLVKDLELQENITIVDMEDIIASQFSWFYQHYAKKLQDIEKSWNIIKLQSQVRNLYENTIHNINLSGYTQQELIDILILNKDSYERSEIYKRAEDATQKYMAFVQSLYDLQVIKNTFPNHIRATCHPKPGQWWINLVNKNSYNYPYNWVGYRNGHTVKVKNEIDMIVDKMTPIRIWEDKQFLMYTKNECISDLSAS